MVKDIMQIGCPVLTTPAKKVTDVKAPEVKALIKDLLDTCKAGKKGTAGLAAPQINVPLRVCICRRVDLEDDDKKKIPDSKLWEVLINPTIAATSAEQSVYWEGCLSIGKGVDLLYGPVSRPLRVSINYIDPKGKPKSISGEGYFAHVMQHELDHLNGILFLQYVQNPANIWKAKDLDIYLEEHGEYPEVV